MNKHISYKSGLATYLDKIHDKYMESNKYVCNKKMHNILTPIINLISIVENIQNTTEINEKLTYLLNIRRTNLLDSCNKSIDKLLNIKEQ